MRKFILYFCIVLLMININAIAELNTSSDIIYTLSEEINLGQIEFAETTIEYFLGMDYQIMEAYDITLKYAYGIVTFQLDYALYDGDFLIIIFNSNQCYYLTPIIINNYILCDFTNIIPDTYHFYLLKNFL